MKCASVFAVFGWLLPFEVAAQVRRRLGRPSLPPLHLDTDERGGPAASAMRHSQCRNCDVAGVMVVAEMKLGFPSRPPADQWASRLKALGNAARADPCNADKIAVAFERSMMGFGSRLNAFINEIFYAMYGNYTLAVCGSTKDGFYERVLSRLFENTVDLPVCTGAPPLCGEATAETMWPGMMLTELLGKVDPTYLVGVKSYLTRLALTPTPATESSVRQRLVEAGLPSKAGTSYIGMHIRRGDKIIWESTAVPATVFAEEAEKYLQNVSMKGRTAQTPFNTVYLASDTASVPTELKKALGPKFTVLQQKWSAAMKEREYDDENEVFRILADIQALADAELFIGSASSNMGRLVYMLRGANRPSISVDDDGEWLKRG